MQAKYQMKRAFVHNKTSHHKIPLNKHMEFKFKNDPRKLTIQQTHGTQFTNCSINKSPHFDKYMALDSRITQEIEIFFWKKGRTFTPDDNDHNPVDPRRSDCRIDGFPSSAWRLSIIARAVLISHLINPQPHFTKEKRKPQIQTTPEEITRNEEVGWSYLIDCSPCKPSNCVLLVGLAPETKQKKKKPKPQ